MNDEILYEPRLDKEFPFLDRCVMRLPKPLAATLKAFPQLFIGGGYLRSQLVGEAVKDIDVFTYSLPVVEQAVEFFIRQCAYEEVLVKETATPCTITVTGRGVPIQFINNVAYESPEACIRSFDFTICQAALWCENMKWRMGYTAAFLRDAVGKQLVYTAPERTEAPGGSLWRAIKFVERGYSLTRDELAKLVVRLNQKLETPCDANDNDAGSRDAPVYLPRRKTHDPEAVKKAFHLPGFSGTY